MQIRTRQWRNALRTTDPSARDRRRSQVKGPAKPVSARARGGAVLAILVLAAGCAFPPLDSEGGLPEPFCGLLYDCGSHSERTRDRPTAATGSSSTPVDDTTSDSETTDGTTGETVTDGQ